MRRGAGRTAECHLRRSGRRGGQPRGRVVLSPAELSRLLTSPRGAYRRSFWRCPGRRASPWLGGSGCPPDRPLPALSTIGVRPWCPPRPVPRPVRCPAVRCPIVGRPLTWLRRPGPTCPAVWRPAVRRPAGWCPPVRPVASVPARVSPPWPWEHASPAGPSGLEWIGFRTACRAPERLRRRLRRLGRRRRCGDRGPTSRRGCRS